MRPSGDGAHRVDQVGVGRALQHVAGGARLEALEEVALVVVHREQQHARVRARARGSRAPPGARSCAASTRRAPRRRGGAAWVDSSAATPSSASATTSMSGWRSISMRRPERTMPWSSAIRTRITSAPRELAIERHGRAAAGGGAHVELAADQAGALGHAAQPEPGAGPSPFDAARERGRVEAARRRRGRAARAARPRPRARRSTAVAPAWRADVRERLLGDPVDGGLHVLGQRRRGRPRVSRRTSTPVRAEKRLSCVSIAGTRPWSSSADRPQLAGEVEQLVHRLVHEPLQLGHLVRALGRASPGRAPRAGAGSR